jgi:hypothetical protein
MPVGPGLRERILQEIHCLRPNYRQARCPQHLEETSLRQKPLTTDDHPRRYQNRTDSCRSATSSIFRPSSSTCSWASGRAPNRPKRRFCQRQLESRLTEGSDASGDALSSSELSSSALPTTSLKKRAYVKAANNRRLILAAINRTDSCRSATSSIFIRRTRRLHAPGPRPSPKSLERRLRQPTWSRLAEERMLQEMHCSSELSSSALPTTS